MWIKPFRILYFQTFGYLCLIKTLIPNSVTDLALIASLFIDKEKENERFRTFLLSEGSEEIDRLVVQLDKTITPSIDCTKCGNCCKSLMINISDEEATSLSNHLGQSRTCFDVSYVEKGSHSMMVMNQMPCYFLQENKCTVYEYRFEGCREFPAMHLPQFQKRLFTTFMHYGRCPIIFNVIEQLKTKMQFRGD